VAVEGRVPGVLLQWLHVSPWGEGVAGEGCEWYDVMNGHGCHSPSYHSEPFPAPLPPPPTPTPPPPSPPEAIFFPPPLACPCTHWVCRNSCRAWLGVAGCCAPSKWRAATTNPGHSMQVGGMAAANPTFLTGVGTLLQMPSQTPPPPCPPLRRGWLQVAALCQVTRCTHLPLICNTNLPARRGCCNMNLPGRLVGAADGESMGLAISSGRTREGRVARRARRREVLRAKREVFLEGGGCCPAAGGQLGRGKHATRGVTLSGLITLSKGGSLANPSPLLRYSSPAPRAPPPRRPSDCWPCAPPPPPPPLQASVR
jgi:hypothetical protein